MGNSTRDLCADSGIYPDNQCGGKGKYAAQYAVGLALYSLAGALVSTALTAIASATKPKHPPKAN